MIEQLFGLAAYGLEWSGELAAGELVDLFGSDLDSVGRGDANLVGDVARLLSGLFGYRSGVLGQFAGFALGLLGKWGRAAGEFGGFALGLLGYRAGALGQFAGFALGLLGKWGAAGEFGGFALGLLGYRAARPASSLALPLACSVSLPAVLAESPALSVVLLLSLTVRLLDRQRPRAGAYMYPSTAHNGPVTESRDAQSDGAPDREPPVLPDVTDDEGEAGWGDRDDERERDDWFLRERPPHHE